MVWVSYNGTLYRCCPEQVRKAVEEEKLAFDLDQVLKDADRHLHPRRKQSNFMTSRRRSSQERRRTSETKEKRSRRTHDQQQLKGLLWCGETVLPFVRPCPFGSFREERK